MAPGCGGVYHVLCGAAAVVCRVVLRIADKHAGKLQLVGNLRNVACYRGCAVSLLSAAVALEHPSRAAPVGPGSCSASPLHTPASSVAWVSKPLEAGPKQAQCRAHRSPLQVASIALLPAQPCCLLHCLGMPGHMLPADVSCGPAWMCLTDPPCSCVVCCLPVCLSVCLSANTPAGRGRCCAHCRGWCVAPLRCARCGGRGTRSRAALLCWPWGGNGQRWCRTDAPAHSHRWGPRGGGCCCCAALQQTVACV